VTSYFKLGTTYRPTHAKQLADRRNAIALWGGTRDPGLVLRVFPIAAPAFGGDPLDCGIICFLREGVRLWVAQRFVQVNSEHRAHGVNCCMPIQAFTHQAIHRPPHWQLIAQRDLILDGDMEDGMQFFIRQRNARASVAVLHPAHRLVLVEGKPLLRIRSDGGIIGLVDVAVLIVIRFCDSVMRLRSLDKIKTAGAEPSVQAVEPPADLGWRLERPGDVTRLPFTAELELGVTGVGGDVGEQRLHCRVVGVRRQSEIARRRPRRAAAFARMEDR